MSQNEPNTDDVERYKNHVRHVTRLIAESLESIDDVSEAKPAEGVIHVHMKPRVPIDGNLTEPLHAHGCFISRVDVRDGGTSVERLHVRAVVEGDELRAGWSQ